MAVKPITPNEVAGKKQEIFPDEVFEAFNEVIATKCVDGRASFTVDEVVAVMVSEGLKRNDIFANHWLDVEDVYRKAGWVVEYDQPGYNEDYSAFFVFTAKKKPQS